MNATNPVSTSSFKETSVDMDVESVSSSTGSTYNSYCQSNQHPDVTATSLDPIRRTVVLERHPEMGFGFVAGSEKPVIVRFVKEGGPSEGKLQSEDQILDINGEDVSRAPRDRVIELVKTCKQSLQMTVCQPAHRITASSSSPSIRKSSLLTAAKKAKLKSNPSRVRFAEGVQVNGNKNEIASPFSSFDSCVPFMPNVLKVFLENGQTKTFKYDSGTLVQDVLSSLVEKLSIKNSLYYSLCVEHVKARRRNKLTLLDPKDSLSKVCECLRGYSCQYPCQYSCTPFYTFLYPLSRLDLFRSCIPFKESDKHLEMAITSGIILTDDVESSLLPFILCF